MNIILQKGLGKTQSRVKMLTAVIGRLVNDINISENARLQMKMDRTDERVTFNIYTAQYLSKLSCYDIQIITIHV